MDAGAGSGLASLVEVLAGAEGRLELLPADLREIEEIVVGLVSLWAVDTAGLSPATAFSPSWGDDG